MYIKNACRIADNIVIFLYKEHIMFISSSNQVFLIGNELSNYIAIEVNYSYSYLWIKQFSEPTGDCNGKIGLQQNLS